MFKTFLQKTYSSETPSSGSIKAVFHSEQLSQALNSVSAAQTDGDVGWIQIHFTGNGKVLVSSVSHILSIRYEFLADHEGQGVVKVLGKQLLDYVKQLPAEKVTFQVELPSKLTVKCGRSSARLQLIQDSTYSGVNIPHSGTSVQVKGDSLARWIDSYRNFVLVDDTRYYANGAYIWADGDAQSSGSMNAVASDALRLAKARLSEDIRVIANDTSAVLVPRKVLDEARRVASSDPGRVFTLRWNQEELFFSLEGDSYAMFAKTISGSYPQYEGAIPQKISTTVHIDNKVLHDSLKRSLIFADRNKILKFAFESQTLSVQSSTPGQKEGEEVIDLLNKVDSEFEVNYNGQQMCGVLECLSGNKAKLEWESVVRPVKITGDGERGIDVFYLLVPTRF
jgi:DNA polymerase-3 subunit beta